MGCSTYTTNAGGSLSLDQGPAALLHPMGHLWLPHQGSPAACAVLRVLCPFLGGDMVMAENDVRGSELFPPQVGAEQHGPCWLPPA